MGKMLDDALKRPMNGSQPREWPRVFNVKRSRFNSWHADISFARCPTDEEIEALERMLRDDHLPAPKL